MSDIDLQALATRATSALDLDGVVVGAPAVLEGGHSGLTLAAPVTGWEGGDRVVLKLAPAGRPAVGRHDVVRQARLMEQLARHGVAVPPIVLVDDSPPPLVGMGWVEGECIEPILDEHDLGADEVRSRALDAARLLGALHAVPVDEVAPNEQPTTPEGELDRWVPTMEAIDPALRPRAPELEKALRSSVPSGVRPAVLHGDFRLGNVLAGDQRVRALSDWEIWSVGDPRVDLGWFCVFTDPATLPGASHHAPGMSTAADLRDEYERAGGSVDDHVWFDALGRFKMAAIMGHNLKRHREGRYHDPYQERLPESILHLVDEGLDLLA